MTDIELAKRQNNQARVEQLKAMCEERFQLMERLSELPKDMTFFTQITMEAAEDTGFLDAMKKARIKGALVGVEAVTAQGLKSVYKDFNLSGDDLVKRLKTFSTHGVHVLGSFIFGLPSDRPDTFDAIREMGEGAGRRCAKGGWNPLDTLLAHSRAQAAEDVHAASLLPNVCKHWYLDR